MSCTHDGFHTIASRYDRQRGVLVYSWICERCGTQLWERERRAYRPRYVPDGDPRHRLVRGTQPESFHLA